MKNKLKTYVLTLSPVFPKNHPRAGEETGFKPKFISALENMPCYHKKLHTIRANYALWRKRFEKIAAGEAVLSIRQWVGKPYGKSSTQIELAKLTHEDGIGIQKLDMELGINIIEEPDSEPFESHIVSDLTLASNDGLSVADWKAWFRNYDKSHPLAIIHFTPFRY